MNTLTLYGSAANGSIMLVDDEDFDFARTWHWSLNSRGYVKRNKTTRQKSNITYQIVFLHREIAKRAGIQFDGTEVDHVNGNKLDNRRVNLRSATRSQNCRNVGIKKSNTTGFKGVCYDRSRNSFVASIRFDGKRQTLGRFATPEEAYTAYCNAAVIHHGEYARLV